MNTAFARELLALGIPPRAVMHLVLQDVLASLSEWTADVLTCDELELVKQARVHIENAEHCMLMLLRPSEALCEPHYPLHLLETDAPPADVADVGVRCLVCGHYHGGHGSCVTSHLFVPPEDCPTCQAEKNEPPSLPSSGGSLASATSKTSAPHTVAGQEPPGSP